MADAQTRANFDTSVPSPDIVPLDLSRADTGRRRSAQLRNNIAKLCTGTRPDSFYIRSGKRIIDATVAISALTAMALPLLAIAIAIRLDSKGPAIFTQQRTGQFGRRFAMYKFRSMVQDAEELKANLQNKNLHGEESPDFKLTDDPRVTRLGGFMRRTSIDELPNLINVVRGDMSLVGPRPTSFDSSTYGYRHLSRLKAKPGITGLWQVSGRATVDFDRRAAMDQHYIENICFAYDLSLIFKTITSNNHGAY